MARKVLLIEDEPDQVKLVTLRLQAQGYEVYSALDGETGLGKVREVKPDIVLLDVLLPKMNGLDVCRQIKGAACTEAIPVILFTALSNEDFDRTARDARANDVLGKPYDAKVLVEKIKLLLGDK